MESALRLSEYLWLLRGATDRPARHHFLRLLAAKTLKCDPAEIGLDTDERGQPRLTAPIPIHVSLSHRPGLTLIGLAPSIIGVDVEASEAGDLAIARDHFSAAEARWLESVDQPDAFARLWTAKEAVLKATGQGIALGLTQPDLSPLLRPGHALDLAKARISFDGTTFDLAWHATPSAIAASALAIEGCHTETAIAPFNAAVPPATPGSGES